MATVATNDKIYEKLAARFTTEGKSVGDLWQRYTRGDVGMVLPGLNTNDWVACNTQDPWRNITSRLWVAVDVAMDDWSPAAGGVLMSNNTILFNLRTWMLQILNTGVVRMMYSPDGVVERIFDSTVNLAGTANFARLAVGADVEGSDGAGNRRVTFYTAPTLDGAWVQLGAVVSQVGNEALPQPRASTIIGAYTVISPSGHTKGKFYGAETKDGGINGTLKSRVRFDSESALGIVQGKRDEVAVGALWSEGANSLNNWATGAQAFTPATPDLDFGTSDLDVRIKVAQADWTHAGVTHWFVHHGAHTNAPADLSWACTIHSDGRLRTAISADGTNFIGPITTNPVGFTDGTEHYLRFTVDLDDGAGNSVFAYYESLDNGQTWVDVGGANPYVEPLGPIVLFNTDAFLSLNNVATGLGASTTQSTKYLEIRKGINGPIVVKADFTNPYALGANYLDQSPTPRQWVNNNVSRASVTQANGANNFALPKYEDYVAHVAAASASLHVGDDENAFWDAFTP